MSKYVTLSSNLSYPNNSLSHFTTQLDEPLELYGSYEVALTDFYYSVDYSVTNLNYIVEYNQDQSDDNNYPIKKDTEKIKKDDDCKGINKKVDQLESEKAQLVIELNREINNHLAVKISHEKLIQILKHHYKESQYLNSEELENIFKIFDTIFYENIFKQKQVLEQEKIQENDKKKEEESKNIEQQKIENKKQEEAKNRDYFSNFFTKIDYECFTFNINIEHYISIFQLLKQKKDDEKYLQQNNQTLNGLFRHSIEGLERIHNNLSNYIETIIKNYEHGYLNNVKVIETITFSLDKLYNLMINHDIANSHYFDYEKIYKKVNEKLSELKKSTNYESTKITSYSTQPKEDLSKKLINFLIERDFSKFIELENTIRADNPHLIKDYINRNLLITETSDFRLFPFSHFALRFFDQKENDIIYAFTSFYEDHNDIKFNLMNSYNYDPWFDDEFIEENFNSTEFLGHLSELNSLIEEYASTINEFYNICLGYNYTQPFEEFLEGIKSVNTKILIIKSPIFDKQKEELKNFINLYERKRIKKQVVAPNQVKVTFEIKDRLDRNEFFEFLQKKIERYAKVLLNLSNIEIELKPNVQSLKFNRNFFDLFYGVNLDNSRYFSFKVDPYIQSVKNFYIFTNVIEDQLLVNSKAPLLRIIKPEGKINNYIHNSFDQPHYLKCNRTYINTIEIKITDQFNNLIKFNKGPIILKLHFKKIKK